MDDEKPTPAADETFSVEKFVNGGGVILPDLCRRHSHDLVVKRLHLRDGDPWLTQLGSTGAINVLLRSQGCLACANGPLYQAVVRVCKKGVAHAAQVAQFKRRDPDWQKWVTP